MYIRNKKKKLSLCYIDEQYNKNKNSPSLHIGVKG